MNDELDLIKLNIYEAFDNGDITYGEKEYLLEQVDYMYEDAYSRKMKTILSKIINLNKKLNLYKYGIPNNGNFIEDPDDEDFFKKYKLLKPDEFEKYKMGVCWDYVTYIAFYFKKNFPFISFKTFFHMIDDKENCPSHTFFLFYLNNYVYWFESSWKQEAGIHKFDHESDAIEYITNKLKKDYQDFDSYLIEYNALDKNLFHKSCNDFMNYMLKRKKKLKKL